MNKTLITILVLIILGGLGYLIATTSPAPSSINSFEDCVAAGYPVMESYPRQCMTPEGRNFTEIITELGPETPATSTTPGQAKACRPTGCSGQICADEDVASTCEYREVYACYKTAKCERQASGACGWTETAELKACITEKSLL